MILFVLLYAISLFIFDSLSINWLKIINLFCVILRVYKKVFYCIIDVYFVNKNKIYNGRFLNKVHLYVIKIYKRKRGIVNFLELFRKY